MACLIIIHQSDAPGIRGVPPGGIWNPTALPPPCIKSLFLTFSLGIWGFM